MSLASEHLLTDLFWKKTVAPPIIIYGLQAEEIEAQPFSLEREF